MSINWNELSDQYNATYAQPGKYKVKIKQITVQDKSNTGSCRVDIEFEKQDKTSYPKASYYLSFKENAKVGWRQFQHMSIMKTICKSEADAQKVIENIEGKSSDDEIIKEYQSSYKRLGEKHSEVEVEVYAEEGNDGRTYTRSMLVGEGPLNNKSTPKKEEAKSAEPLDGEEIDLDEVPF